MSDEQLIISSNGVYSFKKRKWEIWQRASGEWHVRERYTEDYSTFKTLENAIKYLIKETKEYSEKIKGDKTESKDKTK